MGKTGQRRAFSRVSLLFNYFTKKKKRNQIEKVNTIFQPFATIGSNKNKK